MALKVEAAAKTDTGLVRRNNQDSYGSDEQLGLYVVCDGMGGAAGGEIASSVAVESFVSVAKQELSAVSNGNADLIFLSLRRAVAAANRAVMARAAWDICYRGMGSTLVAAKIVEDRLAVINVGDSRAYLVRGGVAVQLTEDHSYVAEQIHKGLMTVAQAERSSMQSVITRAIGVEADVRPDVYEANLMHEDVVLLTSDGLTRYVDDAKIAEMLGRFETVESGCLGLVELAKERGGSDNITCVVLRFTILEGE